MKNSRFSLRRLFTYALVCIVLFIALILGFYIYLMMTLPDLEALQHYEPNLVTRVYSDDGSMIGEFYIERRVVVPIEQIPDNLINAFLAAEDAEFYQHEGISYVGIMRAFYKNLSAGKIVQGASTITQQVARGFFLTPEKKVLRKIKEMILARRIEKRLNKREILALYLNQIYLGKGSYGVQAASMAYFDKNVEDLTLAEAALMAGLPKAPSRYSPYINFLLSKKRQEFILQRMVEERFISVNEADFAKAEKIVLRKYLKKSLWVGPYFTEHVRRYIEDIYGDDVLYKGGLNIYTTLNVDLQKAANKAVKDGLRDFDRRRGYRGAIRAITDPEEVLAYKDLRTTERNGKAPVAGDVLEGIITALNSKTGSITVDMGGLTGVMSRRGYRWARRYNPDEKPEGELVSNAFKLFHEGDVINVKVLKGKTEGPLRVSLYQPPLAQASLLAIDQATGYIKAMVGGGDFTQSQYNRAIQAKRQPGSAFKPIIYSAAFDKGFTPATIIMDTPIVFEDTENALQWRPRNYDRRFGGPTTVRKALAKSRNVVTIKILRKIGLNYCIGYARKLGITTPMTKDLSLALGSSAVTLYDLTSVFSVFANGGKRSEPLFITKIIDKDGIILEDNAPSSTEVISPQTAYLMTKMLEGVIEHGTGWRAKSLGRPAAGKTGTTNGLNDAWFLGYVPSLTTGVWVGYDNEKKLGRHETGSRAALPIWLSFMKAATRGKPVNEFQAPEGVEFARIDSETGELATPYTKNPIFEVFKSGTAPTRQSGPEVIIEDEEDMPLRDDTAAPTINMDTVTE
ncbi:MAG: penicillin-binding protein 1A [Thermodesulfobacteriota bacterium]